MPDLVVDYHALIETEASLQRIAQRLRESEARSAATTSTWGSPRVSEAMTAFVDNWNRHREQLIASLDAVTRHSGQVREGFTATDVQLGAVVGDGGGQR